MTEANTAGIIFICFSLLHGFVAALNCSSPTPESLFAALETELFSKNLLRPVKHFSDTLDVNISMTLVAIIGVNEKEQSLTTFIWQVLEWNIQGLSWDEKECGTDRVAILREKLWVPDIQITEFMDEDKSPIAPYVYLYNTGRVYDDKPIRVVSTCQLVIYTFPFDSQNCSLTFGSYLHFAQDIRMHPSDTPGEDLEESRQMMETKGEWELVDIVIAQNTLDISDGSFSEIKYYIILKRKPTLYVVNLLIPSFFLITLDLFSFLLPPHSVDRSAFKMTLILGYTVFLLIMNDLLPTTGEATTPLMNTLFCVSLALMVASLLETVFITHVQHSAEQYGPVPRWLSVFVLRYVATVVCLRHRTRSITVSLQPTAIVNPSVISSRDLRGLSFDTPQGKLPPEPVMDQLRQLSRDLMAIRLQIDKHFNINKTAHEWQTIGIVIDRLLFGFYILFISVSFLTIMVIWILN